MRVLKLGNMTTAKIHWRLVETLGKEALSESIVRESYKRFNTKSDRIERATKRLSGGQEGIATIEKGFYESRA